MIEPIVGSFQASDGYPLHLTSWPVPEGVGVRGRVVVLHGVQSHGGWYHNLGRRLAEAGFEAHFPDRRGSGANTRDRGHASSDRRLVSDVAVLLDELRGREPPAPIALAGISWGGKLAVVSAGTHPDKVDAVALLCPGLQPRVGVSLGERLRIAVAYLAGSRKTFPIPLTDPALFTADPARQAYIAEDPLCVRQATASLLAASMFLDRRVRFIPGKVRQPALLMLAGQDRIVNNARTLAYFDRLASRDRRVIEYPEAHHTLEFEPDPDRYARDLIAWLGEALPPVGCRDEGNAPAHAP